VHHVQGLALAVNRHRYIAIVGCMSIAAGEEDEGWGGDFSRYKRKEMEKGMESAISQDTHTSTYTYRCTGTLAPTRTDAQAH